MKKIVLFILLVHLFNDIRASYHDSFCLKSIDEAVAYYTYQLKLYNERKISYSQLGTDIGPLPPPEPIKPPSKYANYNIDDFLNANQRFDFFEGQKVFYYDQIAMWATPEYAAALENLLYSNLPQKEWTYYWLCRRDLPNNFKQRLLKATIIQHFPDLPAPSRQYATIDMQIAAERREMLEINPENAQPTKELSTNIATENPVPKVVTPEPSSIKEIKQYVLSLISNKAPRGKPRGIKPTGIKKQNNLVNLPQTNTNRANPITRKDSSYDQISDE